MKLTRKGKSSNARKQSPIVPTPKPATLDTPKAKTSSTRTTKKDLTVLARVDVGFGNALYVRGEGAGLSWEQGQPLACVDGKTWKWTTSATGPVTFKLLVNDCTWAQGPDLRALPGETLEVTPAF